MATEVMAHHTNAVGLGPKLMMVNGDMTKDLRHLDRDNTAWDGQSALANKNALSFDGNNVSGGLMKRHEPPSKKLSSPRGSSISSSEEEDMGPTYVSSSKAQDTTPNLAFLARPFPRRRCQSTPVAGSSQRRTIFDSFWKKDDSTSSPTGDGESDTQSATSASRTPPTPHAFGRGRAHSISIPDSHSPHGSRRQTDEMSESSSPRESIIMRFSPPVKHKSVLMSRFDGLEELSPDLQMTLPELPSPLSRTYRNDGTHYCGGMYPLVSPRPILQKSSYGSDGLDDTSEASSHRSGRLPPLSPFNGEFRKSSKGTMMMPLPLALTDSIHLGSMRRHEGGISAILNDVDSDESSSSQSGNGHRVHFDPRITITEYDDEAPRKWYSDSELEKMKIESILMAQRYLRQHPELMADYCAGVVNPITGVTKKKALYSLPILNDVSLEEGESSDPSTSLNQTSAKEMFLYNYAKKARIHIRKILIVDPNKLILDLFCRSLRQIFPEAELVPVQTGDEALQKIKHLFKEGWSKSVAPRGFDLVIIEEHLHALPLRGYGHSPRQVQTKDSQPKSLTKTKHSSMTQLVDYTKATTTLSNPYHPKLISGADVIGRIKQLEAEFCRADRCILEEDADNFGEEPSQQEQVCWESLVVGVCVDQKHDTLKLWSSGADLVWGKPPPPMGENLRNQLVGMLVRKRSPSSFAN